MLSSGTTQRVLHCYTTATLRKARETVATVKVREAIQRVEADGWYFVRTTGSHRHYKHPTKPGKVTIPGKLSSTLSEATWNSTQKQARLK